MHFVAALASDHVPQICICAHMSECTAVSRGLPRSLSGLKEVPPPPHLSRSAIHQQISIRAHSSYNIFGMKSALHYA